MRALLKEKLAPLPTSGFAVAPSIENLHRIAAVTNETSLVKLLKRFVHNIDVPDGFFYPTNLGKWLQTTWASRTLHAQTPTEIFSIPT